MQQAIEKLRGEMSKKNNPYINLIGEYLISQIDTNPEMAELIMTEGKTIAGSLEAMKSEAKKKQSNGMAMLTDAEGFAIVQKYFGAKEITAPSAAPQVQEIPKKQIISVNLDELL